MQVTADNTLGICFLGTVATSLLFGITLLQGYLYYVNYSKDWLYQRVAVGFLMVCDALHLALTIHAMYHYLITSIGDPRAQFFVVWSLKLQIAVNIIIVMTVQGLYTHRVWKLSRNISKAWPIVTALAVISGYVIGILLVVETYGSKTFEDINHFAWVIYASFASSTMIDIVIATAICYCLYSSSSSFSSTNSLIMTIMKYVFISGFLTSACALTCLITYWTMPNNLVFLAVEFLLTKLYVNSYLGMLNSRNATRMKDASSLIHSTDVFNIRTENASVVRNVPGESHDHREYKETEAMQLSPTDYRFRSDLESRQALDSKLAPQNHIAVSIAVSRTEERPFDRYRPA